MKKFKTLKKKITDYFQRKRLNGEESEESSSDDNFDAASAEKKETLSELTLSTTLMVMGGTGLQPIKVFAIRKERISDLESRLRALPLLRPSSFSFQDPKLKLRRRAASNETRGGLSPIEILQSVTRVLAKLKRDKGQEDLEEQRLSQQLALLQLEIHDQGNQDQEPQLDEVRNALGDLIIECSGAHVQGSGNAGSDGMTPQLLNVTRLKELRFNHGCSIRTLSKRLNCSEYKVRTQIGMRRDLKVIRVSKRNPQSAALSYLSQELIYRELNEACGDISLKELQRLLETKQAVKVSISVIRAHVKGKLGYAYKKVDYLAHRANHETSRLERQVAAYYYIKNFCAGKIIINVDESSIQYTLNRQKVWSKKGRQQFSTSSQRLSQISIIAALSSENKAYFSLSSGKNNSLTVYEFLLKLVLALDSEDSDWREKRVIMLDNASYHRSQYLRERLVHLNLPIMFLGPYHFRLAPVERLFAILKKRPLVCGEYIEQAQSQNEVPLLQKSSRTVEARLIDISRSLLQTRVEWASSLYRKSLIVALEDLTLQKL